MLSNDWSKASKSDNSGANCVEVRFANADDAAGTDMVLIRDSKDKDGKQTVIRLPVDEWNKYLAGLKLGYGAFPSSVTNAPASEWWLIAKEGTVLKFTFGEWDAFMDAVHRGEFDVA
jgi:hypothetical protein